MEAMLVQMLGVGVYVVLTVVAVIVAVVVCVKITNAREVRTVTNFLKNESASS